VAYGINDQGDVVGDLELPFDEVDSSAFIWTASTGQQTLNTGPMGGGGTASFINNSRQIAGPFGFWPSPAAPAQYMADGSSLYAVLDMNNAGQVVGFSESGGGIFSPGSGVSWLGSLNDTTPVWPYGINDLGQVVGMATVDTDTDYGRAFLWTAAEGVRDLNSLVDASGDGWFLHSATGINRSGQIVGLGRHSDEEWVPFLLTPIPEPGFCVVAMAICVCVARSRR
jgi:probable HAF family extracellular repeat protein